jgi:membrane-bound lytic murein transglycosylase D
MPGIKSPPGTPTQSAARVRPRVRTRISLALLAIFSATPAIAADSDGGTQSLQWGSESVSSPIGNMGDDARDTANLDDVWQRIRSGFRIDDSAAQNPLVATHENWYATRPDYVRRMVERSRRYLYHIVQEVDRRGMPMEVALLPMIESAFNSSALSTSAASGIWQFIPSTGRHYGLKQDPWYDGRRDFPAATNAALDYLSKLYLDFGDWQLALAAYNCGEGCIARAIQKNVALGLPTDYASLSLPTETRHYVPKLLAVKNLIRHPEQYGLAIDALPNQPYFNQVTVQATMDVRSAARLADMNHDEFLVLNAAFPRKLIRSDTPVNLIVPVDKAETFQRNLEMGNWDSWQPYAAQKGERPEDIARRFGVSLARLTEHNQIHLKRGKLASAQTILVPVPGRNSLPADTSRNDTLTHAEAIPESASHVVQRGETLFGVARRYGLSTAQLSAANPGTDMNLKVGQTLQLPVHAVTRESTSLRAAAAPVAKKAAKPTRYTVKRGDTLHAIAERFEVSLAELKSWNPAFRKNDQVRTGQSVVVKNI